MKVCELIAELNKLPQDMEVVIEHMDCDVIMDSVYSGEIDIEIQEAPSIGDGNYSTSGSYNYRNNNIVPDRSTKIAVLN